MNENFMSLAVKLSMENIEKGGGPFGAVIVKNGEIIAEATNTVTIDNDPTAHAEINVIKKACKKLNTFNLKNCELYTSCEPCPMCMGAIFWSRLDKVYYANTKNDAKNIDFDDSFIYEQIEIDNDKKEIPFIKMNNSEAIKAFEKWDFLKDKIKY